MKLVTWILTLVGPGVFATMPLVSQPERDWVLIIWTFLFAALGGTAARGTNGQIKKRTTSASEGGTD